MQYSGVPAVLPSQQRGKRNAITEDAWLQYPLSGIGTSDSSPTIYLF
jgi:hypothetical protein